MRPRKKDRHLPAGLHHKHGRFWLVQNNRWTKLSRDYREALAQHAARRDGTGAGMPALIERFLVEVAARKSPRTEKEYRRLGARLKKIFAEFQPHQVRPLHVRQLLDHEARKAPVQANRLRALLSNVFAHAVGWGLAEANPCRDVRGISVRRRDRYVSDEEFNAVQARANVTVACLMDFLYFTAQRISDVLALPRAAVTDEGIFFTQRKTGKKLRVQLTPELRAVVERAKALHPKVKGLTLFHRRGGKPYSYFGISAMFRRAVQKAGVADFHLHDIRAKALTDAHRQGLDAQRLAGHATRSMTDHYVKARAIETAQPPKRGEL